MLAGRTVEQAVLDTLVGDARAGRSGVLVLHGPPGIGKTALLHELAQREGLRVLRATGVEREAAYPHAALAELLSPVLDLRDGLPAVQARALGAALALEDGEAAPFAVAAATLGLLAAAAEDTPLLVVVDDLQWVDRASRDALLFAARRLGEEGVAAVLGLREDEGLDPAELGLPLHALGGLPEDAAVALLDDAGLDPAVATRLVAATGGNPLALREIPVLLSDAQRRGTAPLEDPLPLGRDLDRAFRRRLEPLSTDARRALVVAACTDDAAAVSVHAALDAAGLAAGTLAEAERAGVVAIRGDRLSWAHPLQRAAVLHAAAAPDRRSAHRALADVAPAGSTGRAWHLAAAAQGPDGAAADALQDAATLALRRGAPEEAARAFERVAELREDPELEAGALLAAADAALGAGRMAESAAMARRGAGLTADELVRSDLRAAAARAEMRAGLGTGARELLLREGERVSAKDPVRGGRFLLEAAVIDMTSGRMHRMIEVAARAAAATAEPAPPLAFLAQVLIAEAQLAVGASAAGDAVLEEAAPLLRAWEVGAGPPPVVAMAGQSSMWVERFDRAEAILDRVVAALRDASVVGELSYPLAARANLGFRLGRWPVALADAAEAVRLGRAVGDELSTAPALGVLAEIEAALGRHDDARRHAERCLALATAQGASSNAMYGHGALALLALGQGDPEGAVEHGLAAERTEAQTDVQEAGIVRWLPDLIEALWRLGRTTEAAQRVERLAEQAEWPGHTWAEAVVARSRGLLADPDEVDDCFAVALARHEQTPQPFEVARCRLLHGERLRRDRRRSDARPALRGALATFERLGAVDWAERARTELRATGGEGPATAPVAVTAARPSAALAELTPQELQIALHAARGLTNREVGAALFLAPKTVEHNLSRAFRKLGIRRRVELAAALAAEAVPA